MSTTDFRICHACTVASGADTAEHVRTQGHNPRQHTCGIEANR